MGDLADGASTEMKGSAATPYVLRNTGGVYSCSCPAWRNQSIAIERRTCKHLKKLRGDEAEATRVGVGVTPPMRRAKASAAKTEDDEGRAPPLLLAHKWETHIDLVGWWMSEKLDGVRAYWDGERFWSRLGNVFHAPEWFRAKLPKVPLDGELWAGRKLFQKTVSIVRRQDQSDHWKEIRYVVFDAPASKDPFEERMQFLKGQSQLDVLAHEVCRDVTHLREELARVEALGGEGLMLRKPGSKYEVGRSSTLLKVKTFHDAEGKVLAHLPGAGRHKGRLGALEIITVDGVRVSVGTGFSDAEREDPPDIGSVITFRYQELSRDGVPRFPSYVGVRDDFAWPADAPKKKGNE